MNPNVILCPVDPSATGASALVQAVELARWYDADLHVAHVRGGRALSSFMKEVDTEGLRLTTMASTAPPVLRGAACPVLMVTAAVRRGSHAGGEAVASVETSELVAGLALASR
jgi:hypothetical protein